MVFSTLSLTVQKAKMRSTVRGLEDRKRIPNYSFPGNLPFSVTIFFVTFLFPLTIFPNILSRNKHAFLDSPGGRFSRAPPFVAWASLGREIAYFQP